MKVWRPIAKPTDAGATPNEIYHDQYVYILKPGQAHTRSARESSSCPIKDDFCLHLATLPSKRSKNRPNGMKKKASQRLVRSDGWPKQYRMAERTAMTALH